jgi:hypothetical protein
MFVLLSRNRHPNASPVQGLAIFAECIAFIAHNPLRMDALVTIATPDRTLFQKPLSYRDLVLLTGSEEKSDRFALPIATHMDLGREPALAAP